MNDERKIHRAPLPRIPLRQALGRVIAISFAAVVITFGALSIQMAMGSDPALGPKIAATNAGTDVRSAGTSAGDSQTASTQAPLASVLRSAADDEVQLQQQTTAPAPAPAPTPVQTTTS